ncbi:6-phosphofructokinase 1 [Kineococcus xinjiangensis]|uniref:Pyrophosphate--fructose 6-phosphate 1-phosphotransferase n=1 Tax=Kineococcus xinjiangensis TaxID=512762 RepID=A0A2S6IM32_9ACTN|nr:ATP-dependent 6-phosphofructokinase [Kineococcus xinjiangensis]PPK95279.1 6-phosphofructokinase 1 [Kineococcus xinjiangensis]
MRVGVLTGGGDCPGLNAVIRAAVIAGAQRYGYEFVGFRDGWKGVLEGLTTPLDPARVRPILAVGGTILGSSRTNPLGMEDGIERIRAQMERLGVDALLAIGGEDTLGVATALHEAGVKVVGAPKTIDNDLSATDATFGFDTAVQTAVDACDRLHTTGASHHRLMIVEVMGRHAGWIALHTGMAAGAHVTLLPEEPVDLDHVAATVAEVLERGEAPLAVVSEGAHVGGEESTAHTERDAFGHVQLGGAGERLENELKARIPGLSSRVTVLGHLLRGGTPSAGDRILGTRSGLSAITAVAEGRFGTMAALRGTDVVQVPLSEATGVLKTVPGSRVAETSDLSW